MDALAQSISALIIKVSWFFQVSLYDEVSFETIMKGVEYASVLIFKYPD